MKKTIFYAFLLGATVVFTQSCVDNPYVTEDSYLSKPYAGRSWVVGLKKQVALTLNTVIINTEITSDNYFNNYTQYTKVFDIPQIDYFDPDVNNLQASVQTLREMAKYGIEKILPLDKTLTESEIAYMYFTQGYAWLLGSELFTGLPNENLGEVLNPKQMAQEAIASLLKAYEIEPEKKTKDSYGILIARCYYNLGDKTNATKYASIALDNPDLVYQVLFDGQSSVPNEMQNATFDALPNRLAPLPRLDFLDPKYFSVGNPVADQKSVALVKAEEGFLILAEVALSLNDIKQSQAYLEELLRVVEARPIIMVNDKRETRNGGNRSNYPLTQVKVKFDKDSPFVSGYVLDRQKGDIPVSSISGTKVSKGQILEATTVDELLYVIYLLRQEIFISEGRRLVDLGIRYPISQIEQGNNPNVKPIYTKAQIPTFIPVNYAMDDFTVDPISGDVTMLYDMNKVLVSNKNDSFIMPLFK